MKKQQTIQEKNYDEFVKVYGSKDFDTVELAVEYCKVYKAWWGSNLVILDIQETNGKFNPSFNLFD